MEYGRLIKTAFAIFILVNLQTLLRANENPSNYKEIHVGVILDLGSRVGKVINRCVAKGISDFYTANPHFRTRIVLKTRDTKGEPLLASFAALDFLRNSEVQAIITGPHSTTEARFLELLQQKANMPILSFSTSPFAKQSPYFLQIAQDETSQFKGIATMLESFKQKNIILICEDSANGREMAAYIISSFQDRKIQVTYTSLISISTSNKQILEEIHKFQSMHATMFVMHASPSLSSKLFAVAKEEGMMSEGYAWIISSKTTNFIRFMGSKTIDSMQGVVGFKSYVPKLRKYHGLKKFMGFKEVDYNYGIWAYDAMYALAMAVERVQTEKHATKLSLLNHILKVQFNGLAGEFKFVNHRTLSKPIEVINVIGNCDKGVGFWTVNGKFVKKMGNRSLPSNKGLENIIFPGGATTILKDRRLQMNGKKMRIVVPLFGFPSLVQIVVDPSTNLPNVSGFCGDVFNAAFNALNYKVDIEFIPYFYEEGRTFNDLIDKVYSKEFDAAVGDVTITSNRSRYIDFTLPFSDMGIGTLARNANYKSMWIFLDPFNADLWFTSAGFFLILGFVIWLIEHPTNNEFQGSKRQQIGTTLWFAYSTLVYAHREKLESNLSRFVVTVWVFVVLVLTSSYTATLSSLLTIQQIASKGGSVQFHPGGVEVYNNFKLNDGITVDLHSVDDYAKALRSGRVGFITDEIVYIKSVLALYPGPEFSLVATASTTNGFAFVFQKGSPLTKEMSAEIAKLREDGTLKALEDKWFKRQTSTISKDFSSPSPNILNLYGLRGLFLISGASMALALLVSMAYRACEKCQGKSKIEILRYIFESPTKYMYKIVT